jgi:hypothetical protein
MVKPVRARRESRDRPPVWDRVSAPVGVALLALAATAAFGGCLSAGVAWDDAAVLSANPAVRTLARPWRFFLDPWTINPSGGAMLSQYRPLRTLVYAAQFAVFGGDPWGYHLVSLLLHAACAWAVARLTVRMFGRGGRLAATVWLLHPALSENALYIAAQGNEICLLGVAVAVERHLAWCDDGRVASRAVGLVAAASAMLAYEVGVMMVLLLPLAEAVAADRGLAFKRGWIARYAPLWAVLATYLALRAAVVHAAPHESWWGGSWFAALGLQLRFWLEGWRLTVVPLWQLVRYEVADAPSWGPVLVAVAAHLALGAVVVASLRRRIPTAIWVAVLWWYVAQAPTCNLLVTNLGYPFAPRFLFLALALPIAAAAGWFHDLAGEKPALAYLLAAVLVVFVGVDRRQTAIWHGWRSVFESLVANRNDDLTAHQNLATSLSRAGEPAAALPHAEAATRLEPGSAPNLYSLAELYRVLGRTDEARATYLEAVRVHSAHLWTRVRLAEDELASGRADRARAWIDPIHELHGWPPFARARAEIAVGNVRERLGDCAEARRRAAAAVEAWSYSSEVFFGAGRILLRCGLGEEGRALLRRAAETAGSEYRDMVGEAAWLDS